MEVKELRTVFNILIFCVLKKRCLQILTISLQVNFYQINLIQWFDEDGRSKDKIDAINTDNFESDFFKVRDFYFYERPSWSDDFQQNANKVDFILKSWDLSWKFNIIILKNIYFMQDEKAAS